MTDARTCAECGAPLPADRPQQLCMQHADNVLDVLTQIPELVDDVNLTITRQTATGARNGARSSGDGAIAWDDRASKALAASMARLVSWAKVTMPHLVSEEVALRRALDAAAPVAEDEECDHPEQLSPGNLAVLQRRHDWLRDQITYLTGARWVIATNHRRLITILTDKLDALLARDDALAFARDVDRTRDQLLTASDTPAPRLYLGPCRADPLKTGVLCTAEVYAVDHSDKGNDHICDRCRTVRCPVCTTEHDVGQRRAWLTEALDDRLATAYDIARGLANTTGITATKDQINNWVRKSRLLRHGVDHTGAALYRVGDVIDLAHEAAALATTRHAERPASA